MLKNCFLPVNYDKPTSQTCGEIIFDNLRDFIISCNVCKIKIFEFEDFVKHFKKVHFEEAVALANENKMEATLNGLEEKEIYDNVECLVKVEIGEEQITDNHIEDPIEADKDFQSEAENDGCSDEDKDYLENSEDDEVLEEEAEQSERIFKKPRKQKISGDKLKIPNEYACEMCNKTFQLPRGLQSHIKLVHVRDKPHKCSMCDQSFAQERSLKIHMCEKHTGYDCPQCNHHCANRRILLRHLAMHSGKKDFVCNEKNCGKAFPAQTYLSDHQRQSHSKNLYMCEECGFKCKVRESFYIHQRKHKGEKPFGCQQCDRTFISKSLLAEHKACHETERKHVCDVCGKGFNRYKALFNHKQLHSGVKRYVCKICGSAYAQAPGLSAHMRKHRQQQQEVTYAPDIAPFLSITTEGSIINFDNIFQNSQNLTTLQTVSNSFFSEDQNVKLEQPATFEDMLPKFSKTIEPMFIRLTNEVSSLRQEVNVMRNEVKELKNEKSALKLVMPGNPYKVMDDFLNLEKKLQEDNDFMNSFEKELLTVAKSPNFTKNCWRKLLADELAEKLCWKGTEEKKSVRYLSVAKCIRNAAISIGIAEEEYIKCTKSFFQFAKNRQELKKKYKARPKIINA